MPAGGKREGSGRKPIADKSTLIALRIDDSILTKIKGNRSEFIRIAIEEKLNAVRFD